MTKEFEDRGNTYTIRENVSNIGEVRVADEVVAIIAGLAATEIEGVKSMAGNITNELVSKLGMKNLSKGVKVNEMCIRDRTQTEPTISPVKTGAAMLSGVLITTLTRSSLRSSRRQVS